MPKDKLTVEAFKAKMILLILTISVLSCGQLGQAVKENEGNEVAIKNHPYLVSIQSPTRHSCSGAIISERFVLSAAVCLDKKLISISNDLLTIHAGNNGSVHRIAKIIPHEEYSYDGTTSKNNLVLIQVQDPFVFDDTHQSIKLVDEDVQPDKIGIASNWFDIGQFMNTRKEQLFSARLAVIDRETCNNIYDEGNSFPRPNKILENEFCAMHKDDEGFKSVFYGSPLVVDNRVVGVVSFFDWDVNPVVLTNVAYYRNWIIKHVQLN